jgi:peptidoglycan/LPS O-acetylase OafA/YrhL
VKKITEIPDTFKTTNTLKGIAITAVLINHYLNLNVEGNSGGFANLWISIFFILSGYGIFFSLNRHAANNSNYLFSNEIFIFYYQRLIRIYPLLWIAWLAQLFVGGGYLSFWIPCGIHANGHYWFIPALLQCYLLSPLIYWGIKYKPATFLVVFIAGLIIINLIFLTNNSPIIIEKLADFTNSKWREIYFLHILVFVFGFLSASFVNARKFKIYVGGMSNGILFWFFTFLIVILMLILKHVGHSFLAKTIAFTCIPLILIALLFIYSIIYSVENKYFNFLGSISYSIYLFHMSFYLLLSKFGKYPTNSIKELMWSLALFPFFLFTCYHLERFGNYVNRHLKKLSPFITVHQVTKQVTK